MALKQGDRVEATRSLTFRVPRGTKGVVTKVRFSGRVEVAFDNGETEDHLPESDLKRR